MAATSSARPLTCVAALLLGAQSQDGSDEVAREILETDDLVRLAAVADELGHDGGRRQGCQRDVAGMLKLPTGQLMAIASFALAAL